MLYFLLRTNHLSDLVQHSVDDFLSDGVVAASVVVGGILLSADELLGVEQLAIASRAYNICNIQVQYMNFKVLKNNLQGLHDMYW